MRNFLFGLTVSILAPVSVLAQSGSGGKFFEPEPMSLTSAVFQTMDVNLTESLSEAEIDFYFRFMFLAMDEDDTNSVSSAEFAAVYPALLPVPLDEIDEGGEQLGNEFAAFDANSDGSLSIGEVTGRYAGQVATIDADGNALISLDEFANHPVVTFYNQLDALYLASN